MDIRSLFLSIFFQRFWSHPKIYPNNWNIDCVCRKETQNALENPYNDYPTERKQRAPKKVHERERGDEEERERKRKKSAERANKLRVKIYWTTFWLHDFHHIRNHIHTLTIFAVFFVHFSRFRAFFLCLLVHLLAANATKECHTRLNSHCTLFLFTKFFPQIYNNTNTLGDVLLLLLLLCCCY